MWVNIFGNLWYMSEWSVNNNLNPRWKTSIQGSASHKDCDYSWTSRMHMLVNRVIPKISGIEMQSVSHQPQLMYSKNSYCCMKLTCVKTLWKLIFCWKTESFLPFWLLVTKKHSTCSCSCPKKYSMTTLPLCPRHCKDFSMQTELSLRIDTTTTHKVEFKSSVRVAWKKEKIKCMCLHNGKLKIPFEPEIFW